MDELRSIRARWRERPLFWAALALVAALHALGAAAPLVANDAPLWLGHAARLRASPALEALSGFERFLLLLAPWILCVPLWAASRWRARVALGWPVAGARSSRSPGSSARAPRVFVPAGEWKRQLGDAARALRADPLRSPARRTRASPGGRRPGWRARAIDEQGRYVARASALPDPGGLELPPSPVEVRAGEPARNAARRHPLGTDAQGRDLLARVSGARATRSRSGWPRRCCALVLGTLLGALAGWRGGRTDLVVSRAIELVLVLPGAVPGAARRQRRHAAAISAVWTISAVLGLTGWTGVARLLRAEFLRLREAEFVLAARGLGFSEWRIVLRHALPNALSPLIVATSFFAGSAMLAESAVSYLGAGLVEPEASLGGLVRGGTEHAWMVIFPGAVLALAVIAWNLLGEECANSTTRAARSARREHAARSARTVGLARARPRRFLAVEALDLELAAGEVLAVVGESGCGKSTLLASIPRLFADPGSRIESGSDPPGGPRTRRASPRTSCARCAAPRSASSSRTRRRRSIRCCASAPRSPRAGASAAPVRSSSWRRSACPIPRASLRATRTSSRAACASARCWRWRWRAGRASCSRTSPPARSIPCSGARSSAS